MDPMCCPPPPAGHTARVQADGDIPRLAAAATLEAAHELERAAHELAGTYIRCAREAGLN